MAASQLHSNFARFKIDENEEGDLQSFIRQQDATLQQIFQEEKGKFVDDRSVKDENEPSLSEIKLFIGEVAGDDEAKVILRKEIEEFVEIGNYNGDNQAYLNSLEDAGYNTSDVHHHLETLDTICEKCIEIENVDTITQLKAGDHIRFQRQKVGIHVYNHHAIVVSVNIDKGYMTLVHFQKGKNDYKCKVIKSEEKFNTSDNISKINYHVRPFTATQIIERAEQMAEKYEKNQQAEAYSPFGNNCEHKSNEIATGVKSSDQVDSLSTYLKSSIGWLLKCLLKLAVRLCKGMKHFIRKFAHVAVVATFLIQIDELVSLRYKRQQGLICPKCFDLENGKVLASLIFFLISIGVSLMFHTSWLYFGISGVIAIALPFIASFVIKAVTRIIQPAADIPKTLVKSESKLQIGDVITFTYFGLSHEGVVTERRAIQDSNPNVIKVDLVHFNYPGLFGTRTVVKETFFFDLEKQRVNVYDFSGEKVFEPDKVVEKAMGEIQNQNFNMFNNRSDHLCRLCKIGKKEHRPVPYKQARRISEIKRGDIIKFPYYWFPHDAVVINVGNQESLCCKVVHYKLNGIFGTRSVAEETFTFRLHDQDLFVHDYCGYDVFPATEVVERAKSRVGEEKFHTFTNRSSHVAKWCKMAIVLKKRHSLKEKDLFPVIKKVKDQNERIPATDLARLRVDRCLSSYTMDELDMEFEKLTGWRQTDVLRQTYKPGNIQNVRHLVHFTILEANSVGAPIIKNETVLFQKHTLVGKSLVPVVKKVKHQQANIADVDLARLTANRDLSSYSVEELSMEFEGLTGWAVDVVLPLTRQKRNLQNVRHLVHFTILEANLIGAPRSKDGIVLMKGHTLIGKSLLPVIERVQAQGGIIPDAELARLKKDICLTEYSLEDLSMEFERLTEWTVNDVMLVIQKRKILHVRHLLHFTILEANVVGAPQVEAFNTSFKERH